MNTKKVINRKDAINKLISNKQIITVTGEFFGDEAKGKTVADLSEFVDAIARVNSGENAGHTVVEKEDKFVFHLIPSGILTGKKTYIGSNCVMDPINFVEKEILQLKNANKSFDNLSVGNVYIVLPWHKLVDSMRNPNASTGKGMSPVHQDISGKRGVRLEDFKNSDLKNLEKSFNHWMNVLESQGHTSNSMYNAIKDNVKIPNYIKQFLLEENKLNYIVELINKTINDKELFPRIGNPRSEMNEILEKGGKILIEGPQSFYLSNIEGTHTNSATAAHTHCSGIFGASGLSQDYNLININVGKVPSSRVGSGANPSGYVEQDWFNDKNLTYNKIKDLEIDFNLANNQYLECIESGVFVNKNYLNSNNEEIEVLNEKLKVNEAIAITSSVEYGERGATTGKPRVCGPLDLPHLKHMIKYQNKELTISCIDRLDGLNKIPVVVGYIYNDEKSRISNGITFNKGDKITLDNDLPSEVVLKHCKSIYEILDGWQTSKVVNNEIDKNLNKFFNYIEEKTGAKIISYGNGPDTNDMVYLE